MRTDAQPWSTGRPPAAEEPAAERSTVAAQPVAPVAPAATPAPPVLPPAGAVIPDVTAVPDGTAVLDRTAVPAGMVGVASGGPDRTGGVAPGAVESPASRAASPRPIEAPPLAGPTTEANALPVPLPMSPAPVAN